MAEDLLADRVAAAIPGEDADGRALDLEDPDDRLALVRRAAEASGRLAVSSASPSVPRGKAATPGPRSAPSSG